MRNKFLAFFALIFLLVMLLPLTVFAADDYQANGPYAIYVFDGVYDVPVKAKDGESLYESEEVYHFLICAVCPTSGDYEPGKPEFGFLFPAFVDRSGDPSRICVFHENPDQVQKAVLVRLLK